MRRSGRARKVPVNYGEFDVGSGEEEEEEEEEEAAATSGEEESGEKDSSSSSSGGEEEPGASGAAKDEAVEVVPKKKRGRPKGSKNKIKSKGLLKAIVDDKTGAKVFESEEERKARLLKLKTFVPKGMLAASSSAAGAAAVAAAAAASAERSPMNKSTTSGGSGGPCRSPFSGPLTGSMLPPLSLPPPDRSATSMRLAPASAPALPAPSAGAKAAAAATTAAAVAAAAPTSVTAAPAAAAAGSAAAAAASKMQKRPKVRAEAGAHPGAGPRRSPDLAQPATCETSWNSSEVIKGFLYVGAGWDTQGRVLVNRTPDEKPLRKMRYEWCEAHNMQFALNMAGSPHQKELRGIKYVLPNTESRSIEMNDLDTWSDEMVGGFEAGAAFIELAWQRHLEVKSRRNGAPAPTIFVHCVAGVNRSPMAVVWWLARYHGVAVRDAWELVRSRRDLGAFWKGVTLGGEAPPEGYVPNVDEIERAALRKYQHRFDREPSKPQPKPAQGDGGGGEGDRVRAGTLSAPALACTERDTSPTPPPASDIGGAAAVAAPAPAAATETAGAPDMAGEPLEARAAAAGAGGEAAAGAAAAAAGGEAAAVTAKAALAPGDAKDFSAGEEQASEALAYPKALWFINAEKLLSKYQRWHVGPDGSYIEVPGANPVAATVPLRPDLAPPVAATATRAVSPPPLPPAQPVQVAPEPTPKPFPPQTLEPATTGDKAKQSKVKTKEKKKNSMPLPSPPHPPSKVKNQNPRGTKRLPFAGSEDEAENEELGDPEEAAAAEEEEEEASHDGAGRKGKGEKAPKRSKSGQAVAASVALSERARVLVRSASKDSKDKGRSDGRKDDEEGGCKGLKKKRASKEASEPEPGDNVRDPEPATKARLAGRDGSKDASDDKAAKNAPPAAAAPSTDKAAPHHKRPKVGLSREPVPPAKITVSVKADAEPAPSQPTPAPAAPPKDAAGEELDPDASAARPRSQAASASVEQDLAANPARPKPGKPERDVEERSLSKDKHDRHAMLAAKQAREIKFKGEIESRETAVLERSAASNDKDTDGTTGKNLHELLTQQQLQQAHDAQRVVMLLRQQQQAQEQAQQQAQQQHMHQQHLQLHNLYAALGPGGAAQLAAMQASQGVHMQQLMSAALLQQQQQQQQQMMQRLRAQQVTQQPNQAALLLQLQQQAQQQLQLQNLQLMVQQQHPSPAQQQALQTVQLQLQLLEQQQQGHLRYMELL